MGHQPHNIQPTPSSVQWTSGSSSEIDEGDHKKTTKEGTDMWKAILEWRKATTPGMLSSPAQ